MDKFIALLYHGFYNSESPKLTNFCPKIKPEEKIKDSEIVLKTPPYAAIKVFLSAVRPSGGQKNAVTAPSGGNFPQKAGAAPQKSGQVLRIIKESSVFRGEYPFSKFTFVKHGSNMQICA
ncbi:MAG: hypothetical protein LUC87_06450 [Clostridiales bacterium]|nr:hypothetical protein [Clostridiales bacterium]